MPSEKPPKGGTQNFCALILEMIKLKGSKSNIIAAGLLIWSMLICCLPIRAQDLIATSDITNGASIFIFRQASSKQSTLVAKNFAARPKALRIAAKQNLIAKRRTSRDRLSKTYPTTVAQNKKPAATIRRPAGKKPLNNGASKIRQSETFAENGRNFLDQKDAVSAIENFKKSLALNPNNQGAKIGLSDADTRRADALDVNGDVSGAIPFYREAIQYDANNAAAFGGLGDALDETGDKDGALENYLKALNLDATLEDYFAPAAALYYQKGFYAEAEKYLSKTLAKNPAETEANYFLALVKYKQNQNAEAAAIFERNIAAHPETAENYYYLAAVYDRLNRADDSVNQYKKAVKINPNYAEAWFDLGVIYYNQSNYAEAAIAYGEAIRAQNDFPAAHANLASALRQLKNYEQANAEYASAAKDIKNDPDLFNEWGFCLGKVNKWEKAVERVDAAVALAPEAFAYSNLGWIYYNAAQTDLQQNQKDAADAKLQKGKEVLQKATEINAEFEPAYLNLGVTLTGLSNFAGAVAALTKADSLRDNWLPAINQLGIAFRRSGDLNAAVAQFQKAVGLDKNFAEGFYNLGEAQYRLGNKKEAKKAREALQKLDPTLVRKLDDVIAGKVMDAGANKIQNEIQKKNPLKKISKLPF